jgi:endonuclease/exonuclease/phosphatase family metal-dependent hydrolase
MEGGSLSVPFSHIFRNFIKLEFAVCILLICISVGCENAHNISTVIPGGTPAQNNFLTVMSYNIRVGYGGKDRGVDLSMRKETLPPIVAAIQSIDPDIIGLQEVRGHGQARRLAEKLNMNYAYEGHRTGSSRPSWWGVAVLSKYPILKAKGIQISSGRGNTKSALISTVDINGQPTVFFSIHKDRDLKSGSPFKVIMHAVDKIGGPIVLIGDFNVHPSDPRLELLKQRFIDTAMAVDTEGAKNARSTGTFWGLGRIDYVLVDPQYFAVQDAGIISFKHAGASDHLAYYSRIIPKF